MEPRHDADEVKEQIAADLLWQYVERLRQTPEGKAPPRFSAAELAELTQVLEGAGALAAALPDEAPAACRVTVQRRVEELLAARQGQERLRPQRRHLPELWRSPRWQARATAGIAACLALALATVGLWHRPPTEVRTVAVPMEVRDVEPIAEADAHALLPRMVKNELSPPEEKNLMWHMLVCPGCYDVYVEMRQAHRIADAAAPPRVRFTSERR
jgi:hypothetical protein